MGGPEMAPHTPQRSSRPGEAVARLDPHTLVAPRRSRGAPRPATLVAPRRSRGAPRPPTLGAPRGSRGAPRYSDRLRVQNRAAGMAPPGAVSCLMALHLVERAHSFLQFRLRRPGVAAGR